MEKHDLLIGTTIILTILVFVNLFITFGGDNGMESVTGSVIANPELVCNDPYIRFGDGCCLDNNSNKVCDSDEQAVVETIEEVEDENLDECTAKCPENQICKKIINKNNEARYACTDDTKNLLGSKDSL